MSILAEKNVQRNTPATEIVPRSCPDCHGTGVLAHLGLPNFECITCGGSGILTVYAVAFSEVAR